MDKIKRWNKLAVWVGDNIINIDREMRSFKEEGTRDYFKTTRDTLRDVLNKMEEIEKEIPEPDENCDRKNNNFYDTNKSQDNFVVKESRECPWCHEDYIFKEGHFCKVWSKHMQDSV